MNKRGIMKFLLVVTFLVHHTYMINDKEYVDYVLDGEEYRGVYIEDMSDHLSNAINHEIERGTKR